GCHWAPRPGSAGPARAGVLGDGARPPRHGSLRPGVGGGNGGRAPRLTVAPAKRVPAPGSGSAVRGGGRSRARVSSGTVVLFPLALLWLGVIVLLAVRHRPPAARPPEPDDPRRWRPRRRRGESRRRERSAQPDAHDPAVAAAPLLARPRDRGGRWPPRSSQPLLLDGRGRREQVEPKTLRVSRATGVGAVVSASTVRGLSPIAGVRRECAHDRPARPLGAVPAAAARRRRTDGGVVRTRRLRRLRPEEPLGIYGGARRGGGRWQDDSGSRRPRPQPRRR